MDELELLGKNLTKDIGSNEAYETRVDLDRQEGKLVGIPEIEYKNSILLNYFVNYLFNLGLEFFPEMPSFLKRPLQADRPTRLWPIRFRDILKMQLGECLYYFDKLPLVRDAGLMQNILCIGLWLSFNQKYSRKDP